MPSQESNKKLFLRRGELCVCVCVLCELCVTARAGDLLTDEVWGDDFR